MFIMWYSADSVYKTVLLLHRYRELQLWEVLFVFFCDNEVKYFKNLNVII